MHDEATIFACILPPNNRTMFMSFPLKINIFLALLGPQHFKHPSLVTAPGIVDYMLYRSKYMKYYFFLDFWPDDMQRKNGPNQRSKFLLKSRGP